MNRFRYDMVLHLDQTDTPVAEPQCLDWQGEQLNLETIERILKYYAWGASSTKIYL
ncbi:hypothetical protein VB735_29940 [Halotia wernerae UHCC 0503]|nr:hypothetical protein [Halotia wernerae UHCC 0503]